MSKGKGRSLSLVEDASERCSYSIQNVSDQIRLKVKCKECGGKGSLSEGKCRNGVIGILLEEPLPSSIVLSGYVETLYEDEAVVLMQKMTGILRGIRQFGERRTGEDSDRCDKCKRSPRYIFGKIEKAFNRSLPTLNREMKIQSTGLSANRDTCGNCIESTKSDLQMLQASMEDLKSFILRNAFRISVVQG
ncbi:MAG: hypothetical protein JSV43_03750 [Methanobacteriota archaeon]|nr:MAG: hypothetical protein JSV43_03750 [Euryarchaeota archaeon]